MLIRYLALATMPLPDYDEVWHTAPNGSHLCALTDGEFGWLMYLRESGDAGFSSRNPDYNGPPNRKLAFRLGNGQVDEYLAAWCYPIEIIDRAVEHFVTTAMPPTFIHWHNDSGDGRPIVQPPPRHGERSGRAR